MFTTSPVDEKYEGAIEEREETSNFQLYRVIKHNGKDSIDSDNKECLD